METARPAEVVVDFGLEWNPVYDVAWPDDATRVAVAGHPLKIVQVGPGTWSELEDFDCIHLDWSRRGILLVRNAQSFPWTYPRIQIVNPAGQLAEEYELRGILGAVEHPSYSPNLQRVLFAGSKLPGDPMELYVFDLETAQVIETGVLGRLPDWGGGRPLAVTDAAGGSLPVEWGALKAAAAP